MSYLFDHILFVTFLEEKYGTVTSHFYTLSFTNVKTERNYRYGNRERNTPPLSMYVFHERYSINFKLGIESINTI